MAKEQGIAPLKAAFDAGFNAFNTVIQNEKGLFWNPPNPYPKNTLVHKDWERGFQCAYNENLKKNSSCA